MNMRWFSSETNRLRDVYTIWGRRGYRHPKVAIQWPRFTFCFYPHRNSHGIFFFSHIGHRVFPDFHYCWQNKFLLTRGFSFFSFFFFFLLLFVLFCFFLCLFFFFFFFARLTGQGNAVFLIRQWCHFLSQSNWRFSKYSGLIWILIWGNCLSTQNTVGENGNPELWLP